MSETPFTSSLLGVKLAEKPVKFNIFVDKDDTKRFEQAVRDIGGVKLSESFVDSEGTSYHLEGPSDKMSKVSEWARTNLK